ARIRRILLLSGGDRGGLRVPQWPAGAFQMSEIQSKPMALAPYQWRNTAMRDMVAVLVVAAVAVVLYFLFPTNLALLTRIIAVMFLVLSLDLVTGFAGVATLGHATLFGAGAYAAGIMATKFGINDPLAMLA